MEFPTLHFCFKFSASFKNIFCSMNQSNLNQNYSSIKSMILDKVFLFSIPLAEFIYLGGCKPTYQKSSNICTDICKSSQLSTLRRGKNGCPCGKYGCQMGWFIPTDTLHITTFMMDDNNNLIIKIILTKIYFE